MTGPGKYATLLEQVGCRVYCLGMPPGRPTLRGIRCLWRLCRSQRPDVVQTWLYHADFIGGVVARLAGVKSIVWGLHSSHLAVRHMKWHVSVVIRVCALLSWWLPKRIISCSRKAVTSHGRLGYRTAKMRVIANGYDLQRFSPRPEDGARWRREQGFNPDHVLIGNVARFDPQKDHPNLFRALAVLKTQGFDVKCLLVGQGMTADNRRLRQWIELTDTGDCVKLLGRRDDIPDFMNALDIHVLSSLGEAFPNVLSEAMACGTPCVATDVGDVALILGETGWVVPAGNPEALAAALSQAITATREPAGWAHRREAARARVVSEFGIERMVDAYREAWHESIGQR